MNPGILEMIIGLAMTIKNCVIVIDDFEGYLSSTKNPEHIIFLCTYCRHRKVSVIYTSRRPQLLPTIINSNTLMFIIFKTTEPNTLNYLSTSCPSLSAQDTKQLISGLDFDKYECYIYPDNITGILG